MQSTPPILGRPDPRRIHSAAEHAKTKATLECFMETTNDGMNELGRQTQLTYNVASHHIGLLEGQVSSLHEEVQNVEARSGGNEGRMDVFEGRLKTCTRGAAPQPATPQRFGATRCSSAARWHAARGRIVLHGSKCCPPRKSATWAALARVERTPEA